jgi:hypothetical protein
MTIDDNYWVNNPEHRLVFDEEFVRMTDSSKIMWSIYMYCDPRSSIAMEQDDAKRLEWIAKYYEFNPEHYKDIIDIYKELIPEIEVDLYKLIIDFKKSITFVTDLAMTAQNMTVKLKAAADLPKYIDIIIKKKKEVMQARTTGSSAQGVGGRQPSRLEQGQIGNG